MRNAGVTSYVRFNAKTILALSALIGLGIDIYTSKGVLGAIKLFNYYTIQSNLILLIILLVSIGYDFKHHENPKWLKVLIESATLWILVTGIIYYFMLSAIHHPKGLDIVANILLHYVTPFGMALFYLLLHESDKMVSLFKDSRQLLYTWIIYPFVYSLVSLIRGGITGFYPYWFLRPSGTYPDGAGNILNVLAIIVGMILAFLILGMALWNIKKLLNKLYI